MEEENSFDKFDDVYIKAKVGVNTYTQQNLNDKAIKITEDGIYLLKTTSDYVLIEATGVNTSCPEYNRLYLKFPEYIKVDDLQKDINKHIEDVKENIKKENQYNMEMAKLQYDNPTKNENGEWVSAKTLKEIIGILANRNEIKSESK